MFLYFLFLFNDQKIFKFIIVYLFLHSKIIICKIKKDNTHALVHILATLLLINDLKLL